MRNNTPNNKQIWNATLHKYVLKSELANANTAILEHITTLNSEVVSEQLSLLSSISNFHWWKYVRCDGHKSSVDICVNLTDHQYSDTLKLKYITKSLRNRLMYYIYSDTVYPDAMKRLIDQIIGKDRREDSPYTEQFSDDSQSSHHQLQPNRRKYSTCVLKVTPEILCQRMHVNVPFDWCLHEDACRIIGAQFLVFLAVLRTVSYYIILYIITYYLVKGSISGITKIV